MEIDILMFLIPYGECWPTSVMISVCFCIASRRRSIFSSSFKKGFNYIYSNINVTQIIHVHIFLIQYISLAIHQDNEEQMFELHCSLLLLIYLRTLRFCWYTLYFICKTYSLYTPCLLILGTNDWKNQKVQWVMNRYFIIFVTTV